MTDTIYDLNRSDPLVVVLIRGGFGRTVFFIFDGSDAFAVVARMSKKSSNIIRIPRTTASYIFYYKSLNS